MTIYFGVLEGSGKNWGVWFPDVPGCVGAGNTEEEALESARAALMLFDKLDRHEDLASPPARTYEDLLSDEDVREALANGDRLMPFDMVTLETEVKLRA